MEISVKMYTLSTCSHCTAIKIFLDKFAVKYEFTDVDLLSGERQSAALEEVKKLNRDCTFPTIIIGDRVIIGFKEKDVREALCL